MLVYSVFVCVCGGRVCVGPLFRVVLQFLMSFLVQH